MSKSFLHIWALTYFVKAIKISLRMAMKVLFILISTSIYLFLVLIGKEEGTQRRCGGQVKISILYQFYLIILGWSVEWCNCFVYLLAKVECEIWQASNDAYFEWSSLRKWFHSIHIQVHVWENWTINECCWYTRKCSLRCSRIWYACEEIKHVKNGFCFSN